MAGINLSEQPLDRKLHLLRALGLLPSGAGLHAYVVQHDPQCPFWQGDPCTCDPDIQNDPYTVVHLVCRRCYRRYGTGPHDGALECPACGYEPLSYCCTWGGKQPRCGA